MRKAGLLTAGDIETMKSQKIPGDKKGRTYGQLYKAKFINIERQVSAQARQDWSNSEADRKMEFQQAEQQLVDAFIDGSDTDGFTDEQIETFQKKFEKSYGRRSTKLEMIRKSSSVDSVTKKAQKEQIETLAAAGMLTPEA